MAITRRCPLSCAHCCSSSALSSEQYGVDPFLRLADTFTRDERPDVLLLTGGEALLRARLVRDLTRRAGAVGTRTYLLSGMFFARPGGALPPSLAPAITGVDHFAASIDEFHEKEVARVAVFDTLAALQSQGMDVSLQVAAFSPQDDYLVDLLADVERTFGDRLPVLVTQLQPVGRAATWLRPAVVEGVTAVAARPPVDSWPSRLEPCSMAHWPVVGYDGTVLACCNQDLLDRPPAPHLVLGSAGELSWAELRRSYEDRTVLRALRTYGPRTVGASLLPSAVTAGCDGYCATCTLLGPVAEDPALVQYMQSPLGRAVEREVSAALGRQGPEAFLGRAAVAGTADLALQGAGR